MVCFCWNGDERQGTTAAGSVVPIAVCTDDFVASPPINLLKAAKTCFYDSDPQTDWGAGEAFEGTRTPSRTSTVSKACNAG